ncbi:MAG: DegT/DnrJ/EryC1/StrS family aminotransferase, partial [Bacteroidetes bacterium]|nr:DegT/DnrJ/EryC1/StrS family aminotransferase [Bacteroidota bacterium]
KPDDFPVAYQYQQEILSLPLYPELQEEQLVRVAEVIKGF